MKELLFFQKEASPLRRLLMLKAVAGGVPLSEYTATGNPLTFETNIAKPLKSLVIPWTPTQSGTGDPSPENVRPISGVSSLNVIHTGKNLYANSSVSFTRLKQVDLTNKLNPGEYTISAVVASSDTEQTTCRIAVMNGETTLATVFVNRSSGSERVSEMFTITDVATAIIFYSSNNYGNSGGKTGSFTDIQIELGETQSEYSPYTGETVSVAFPALGNNLFDEQYPDISATIKYRSIYVGEGTFTLSSDATNISGALLFLITGQATSGASTNSNGVWNGRTRTVTATDGYITIAYVKRNSGAETPVGSHTMLNAGSTAQTYEPYTNTVYGGTLDLTTGVLTANIVTAHIDGNSILGFDGPYGVSTIRYRAYTSSLSPAPKIVSSFGNALADKFKYESNSYPNINCVSINNNKSVLVGVPGEITSKDDAISWLNDMGGFNVVYELAEPVTYQLTPQEITSLIGTNVLWSDTNGSNTAVYLKKG